jgi:hypothetical protein
MTVMLSALHAGRALPPEMFRYSILLEADYYCTEVTNHGGMLLLPRAFPWRDAQLHTDAPGPLSNMT